MKILFCVQGEGRGHMTQAIALKEVVLSAGYELVGIIIGTGEAREVPAFVQREFPDRIHTIQSPHFIFARNNAISPMRTGIHVLLGLGRHRESIRRIHAIIHETRPDLIVNFYEPITGFTKWLHPELPPMLAVGHQFMLEHPGYIKDSPFPFQRRLMRVFNRVIGAGALKAALSFYPAEDLLGRGVFVCPPLLRRGLFEMPPPTNQGFVLAYLFNHGYARELAKWHDSHPDVELHCFCNRAGELESLNAAHRHFHELDGNKFLDMMNRCQAVVCSAGFETVCEAAYLGKPLMMIPVKNHVEQEMNARDAENTGFGIHSKDYNLNRLLEMTVRSSPDAFRGWIGQARQRFLDLMERAANGRQKQEELFNKQTEPTAKPV